MSFSMQKLGRHLPQTVLLASMIGLLPMSVSAEDQAQAEATVAPATQAEQSPAQAPAQANAAASNVSTGFDLSLPVDFKRCQMNRELNAYLDKLAPDDIEGLMDVQKFLVDCQGVMEQYLSKTQNKLSELKANAPAIEAAAANAAEAEAQAAADKAAKAEQ